MAETTPVVPQNKAGEQTDPSALATQALWREVAHLKELVFNRLDSLRSAIDEAHEDQVRLKESLQIQIVDESRLRDEKFASIQTQFAERDVRTDTSRASDKTAVDAALQAQKESAGKQAEAFQDATNKSEQQFTKQMDQQSELLKTEVRSLLAQINELKDRFNRGEGVGVGTRETKTAQQDSGRFVIAIVGLLFAILMGVLGFVVARP